MIHVCYVIYFMFCHSIHELILKTLFTLNPSSQENFQGGWYVAESGEDEGRAGFSKVTMLYKN